MLLNIATILSIVYCSGLSFSAFAMPEGLSASADLRSNLPKELMRSLDALFSVGSGHPGLRSLLASVTFSSVKESLSQRFAAFNSQNNKIVLNETLSKQIPAQQILVLAHEVGHAYVYAKMSPDMLFQWSEKYGPWKNETKQITYAKVPKKFEDRVLMQPHQEKDAPARIISGLPNTPSRYALSNRHEWLAECFAQWVSAEISGDKATLGKAIDPSLAAEFAKTLNR
jgi:hypothetical protein